MTFEDARKTIEYMFTKSYWATQEIAMYPDNYQGTISNKTEFLRLNIMPSNSTSTFGGQKAVQGLVIISIYTKAGEGQKRVMEIADILDILLENKTTSTTIAGTAITGPEFGTSYLAINGLDPANKALYSAQYTIPFQSYGE